MGLSRQLSFACLLLVMGLQAQELQVIQEERTYKEVDGTTLKADLFYTEEALLRERNPAIAFFHGGGWAFGSPSEFHETCRRYALKGFVTLSFQYRLSVNPDGSFPHPRITPVESVKDARSAIRWIREHSDSLHIDPERIIAAGQSAGGQLVLSTVLCDPVNEASDNLDIPTRPAALLLFSSNVNTVEAWLDLLMGDRRGEIWSISPYHNLKAGMPPAIAFHGEEDCMVPIWIVRTFLEKALQYGNQIEFVALEGRPHYLAEGEQKYATYFDEGILEVTDDFLSRHGFMDPF
jgi:acetyl esterase/lipase